MKRWFTGPTAYLRLAGSVDQEGIEFLVWRIRRKLGMSGVLFANQLLRETGVEVGLESFDRLRRRHAEAILRRAVEMRPLPDACDLLGGLTGAGSRWAIATSRPM